MLCSRPPEIPRNGKAKRIDAGGRSWGVGSVSESSSTAGFRMFYPVDADGKILLAPALTPTELAAIEADRRRAREALSKLSLATFQRGEPDHPMVRAYLKNRGIDVADLPGGVVPAAVRWVADAPAWPRWKDGRIVTTGEPRGAMCALVMRSRDGDDAEGRRVRGLHMTYLVGSADRPESVRKLPPSKGKTKDGREYERTIARAWCGPCDGVARLGRSPTDVPGGVLLFGEGLETTEAAMAGTGYVGWAWLSANRLTAVELLPELCTVDERGVPLVHTIVLAGDLDKVVDRRGKVSKTGQRKTAAAAASIRERYPWVTVLERFPTPEVAAELVRRATEADQHCEPGEPVPVNAEKGVDWDDVAKLDGGVGGRERVRRGLLEGVDVAGNATRAKEWWFKHGAAWSDPGRAEDRAGEVGGAEAGSGVRAIGAAVELVGVDAGVDGSVAGRIGSRPKPAPTAPNAAPGPDWGGGEDDGEGGEDEGIAEISDLPHLVRFSGVHEAERGLWCEARASEDSDWVECLSARGIDKAKLFLLRECWRDGWGRPGLVYWAGKFFRFQGGGYREYGEGLMFRWVAAWLENKRTYKRDKSRLRIVRVNPTQNLVNEVLKHLQTLVYVESDSMPAWLPCMLDENGLPDWEAGFETRRVDERAGDAAEYISDAGGLIWLGQLPAMWKFYRGRPKGAIGEYVIERLRHTPLLFVTTTRDYLIPIEVVEAAIVDGAWRDVHFAWAGAEYFSRWLHEATDPDGPQEGESRRRQLGQQIADLITPDRRWSEIIHIFAGAKRGGKGVIAAAVRAAGGRGSAWPGKLRNLQTDMGVTAFLGRQAVLFEDMHVGTFVDAPEVVETLKSSSGNDRVQFRGLYQEFGETLPTWRYAIFLNELPTKLRDESGVLASRFVVWPLRVSFYGRTDAGVKRGVESEGAGIAAWALFHYAELFAMPRPAIVMSETANEMREQLEDATSHLPRFVDAVFEKDEPSGGGPKRVIASPENTNRHVTYEEMRDVYLVWCEVEGITTPLHPNRLGAPLQTIVPGVRFSTTLKAVDGREVRGFKGIQLNQAAVQILKQASQARRQSSPGRSHEYGDDPFARGGQMRLPPTT